MSDPPNASDAETAAYRDGKRAGLAIAALAIAIVAFINLLNVEKSLLAIVFAILSLRGATRGVVRQWAQSAVVVAIIHIIIVVILVVVYHSFFIQLLRLLQKLS